MTQPRKDARYADVLRQLFLLRRFGVKLDLTAPRRALRRLKNPHRRYPSVHIAGTNGKGSTAAMVESILRSAGLRTGLFTSPHLCRFTERIRVEGREVARDEVCRLYDRVSETAPELTFFERTALMAFSYFAEQEVDIAIVEAGLGGRLDVTNLLEPEVTVITQVSFDHTAYLGRQISRIAWEKGGILKPGVGAVLAPGDSPEARTSLARIAEARGASPRWHGKDFDLSPVEDSAATPSQGPWLYRGPGGPLRVAEVGLEGAHQLTNAATALAAAGELALATRFSISDEARLSGLSSVRWPGRSELLVAEDGTRFLLDAAHNPGGTEALVDLMKETDHEKVLLVTGAMHDKDVKASIAPLAPHTDRLILTRASYYRAAPIERMRALLGDGGETASAAEPVAEALALARKEAGPKDLVVVTGSVFLLGEARALLLGEQTDPYQVTDPVTGEESPRKQNAPPPRAVRHARL